jgi:hypothetical protein
MKIGIVIPLKAKIISKNWDQVCDSLQQTVGSVLGQQCQDFRVVVVGHNCPDFLEEVAHNGECIFVDFDELEPPKRTTDEPSNQLKYETDRCSKILKGIIALKHKDEHITHWFALDADDLVHDLFVSTLTQLPEYDGFLIKSGYFYFHQHGIFNKTKEFHMYCGSSAIISDKFFKLPKKINEKSFREIPFGNVSHGDMDKYFESMNISYNSPSAPLMMYVRGHGDNISDGYINSWLIRIKQKIGMLVRMRILSAKTKKAFGLTIR